MLREFFYSLVLPTDQGFSWRILVAGLRCNVTREIFWKGLLIWIKNIHRLSNVRWKILPSNGEFSDLWCLMNTLRLSETMEQAYISHEFLKIFVVCMACTVYIENDFMACLCLVILFPWNLTLSTIVLFLCVIIIRHNSSPNSSPKQRRRTEGVVEMEPCQRVS